MELELDDDERRWRDEISALADTLDWAWMQRTRAELAEYSRGIRSWSLRMAAQRDELIEIARSVLDPARRDDLEHVWSYNKGMPLPRWAAEPDGEARS